MSDLRYIIMCHGPGQPAEQVGYHCSEPVKNGPGTGGGYHGGFDANIADAIVHDNPILAYLERRRMADIYFRYTMSVKSMSAKELFKMRLIG